MKIKVIMLLGLIILAASGALAGSTGKIVGKVTDALTGKGLPNANVVIFGIQEGGGVTDADGNYVIICVPPGTYTVEASCSDRPITRAENVRIAVDLTTRRNFKLGPTGYGKGDIVTIVDAEPPQIQSSQLKGTTITPHMEQAIGPGKNVLYCSTVQIAWNALQDKFKKEPIHLEGDPPMAQALNKRLSTKADLPEESYVAMAGVLKEEFLQRLNKLLKEKFGDQAPPEVKEPIRSGPPQIFAYAYLFKNLQFEKPFELLANPLPFNSEAYTIAFGIDRYQDDEKHREMGKQVKVIEYKSEDQFVIHLQTKSVNDVMVLAKVKPETTLLKTIQAVEGTTNIGYWDEPRLRKEETLRIPVLNFNVNHTFPELSGKLMNKGKRDWSIGRVTQWTRFKLNQKGAMLKSEARIGGLADNMPSLKEYPPRKFIFDKPFLIYLKQKGAKYPYFAMWVGNTELMVKAK